MASVDHDGQPARIDGHCLWQDISSDHNHGLCSSAEGQT